MQSGKIAETRISQAGVESTMANGNATPKLSVAIKTYNHAPYISACLNSVLGQPFEDFEVIVTDDASTDGTPNVVRSFEDPKIQLEILPQNLGISGSMNRTIARARGEYIAILNSDDYALPSRFIEQVEYLDSHPEVDAIFGQPFLISENGEPSTSTWDYLPPSHSSREAWLRHFFFHCNFICAPTAMIRRKAYDVVGRYDMRLTQLQDFDMWVRFLIHDQKMVLLPEQFTAFRIRDYKRNASAGTIENATRTQFEFAMILSKFRGLGEGLLRNVFSADILSGRIHPDGKSTDIWLSELALSIGSPAHNLFALLTLFESARELDDFRRLRDVTGSIDISGRSLKEAVEALTPLESRLGFLEPHVANLQQEIENIRAKSIHSRLQNWVEFFRR